MPKESNQNKPLKKKGLMEWKKNETLLTCNGVPVAEIFAKIDDIFGDRYYCVNYLDRVIAPGKMKGWKEQEKARAHIIKRFGL